MNKKYVYVILIVALIGAVFASGFGVSSCQQKYEATSGSIIPIIGGVWDVGSETKPFRNGWFSDNLSIKGTLGKINLGDPTDLDDLDWRGVSENWTAGENVTAGDFVYRASTGKVFKTVATDNTTCKAIGLALYDVAADALSQFLTLGNYRNDSVFGGFAAGDALFLDPASDGAAATTIPGTTGDEIVYVADIVDAGIVSLRLDGTWVEVP